MLLGYSRGKVGSLVFKRQNGQQVTVPRVTPPNPQTHSQMMRRVAFASATKTAKALKTIIDHSFQGVQYGEKSVQHFVKMAAKKAYAGVATADMSTLSNAPFQLAPVVPPLAYGVASGGEFVVSQGNLASCAISLSDETITMANITTTTTLAQFCEILGITMDSQLTFICGLEEDLETESEYVMKGIKYEVVRINFKQDAGSTIIVGENGALNAEAIDLERSSSMEDIAKVFSFEPEPGESQLPVRIYDGTWRNWRYYAIIVSKFENGGWRRSNETLANRYALTGETQPQMQENTAYNDLNEVIALYKKQSLVSREEYLNQEANPM